MKKELIYVAVVAVILCIVGVAAYLVMADAGYFDKADSLTGTGTGGVVLFPLLRYLWRKAVQLFYLLVAIAIWVLIICGIGVVFT